MENEQDIFAMRLKELRTSKRLTQKELSEKIGVSANTIISYEKSQKMPSLDVASKLALFFDVSLDWLCGLSDKIDTEMSATCDNVIRTLVRLDALVNISIRSCDCAYRESNYVQDTNLYDCTLYIGSPTISKFLDDWGKMKGLLAGDAIDVDLYNLWLEKKLSDMKNKLVDSDDDFPV